MNIEILLNYVKDYSSKDKELIIRAYEYASIIHKGVKRKSGEDYIIHPLSVACILAEMHADANTIAAGLLHDTIEDGDNVTKEKLAEIFNPTIAVLVDGVTKMKKMEFNNDKQMTDEANTRKIVESITRDVRIFIIKLADRLHNMRTLQYHKPEKQIENAIETRELFIPFASLIGAYSIKSELEDLCFKYLEPIEYNKMQVLKNNIDILYRDVLNEVVCTVAQTLNSNNIPFNILVRVKNLYGLYQKLRTYGDINKIHDMLSIKVLFNNSETCYWFNEQIKLIYKEIPEKTKDYIKTPKTNLYSALHTSVECPDGKIIQFQLLTNEMHKVNSHGLTASWKLLKSENNLSPAEKMQDDVKKLQFFGLIEELVGLDISNSKFNKEIKDNLLSRKVYINTPKGDVIELPFGSTGIDFAYKIHTDVGNSMYGIEVNGARVPIDYLLQNKDLVNILADEDFIGPRVDSLPLCKTGHAKRKIKELRKSYYKAPINN